MKKFDVDDIALNILNISFAILALVVAICVSVLFIWVTLGCIGVL